MKKINLIIFALIIMPQVLFSQIKKIEKGTKQSISKTIKGGNSKGNTKAADQSGYLSTNKCFYSATPQGFTVEINNLTDNQTGAQFHIIIVNRITPKVYSYKKNGVTIFPPDEEETYLGNQTSNHGVLNGGSGWARNESGLILQGDIYRYKGDKFGVGNVYTGSRQQKQLLGFYQGDCSISSLRLSIKQAFPNVPTIEGSSTAFNDHSEPQTSSGTGTQTDWAGQQYADYYAANGQPGWHYTMTEYSTDILSGLILAKLGGFLVGGNVNLNKLTTQADYNALRQQISRLRYEQYVAYREENPFKFKYLEIDHYTLTPIEEEDVQLEVFPNNIQEVELVVPIGFGTPDYPSPKAPGGAYSTKKIYPSYLFDVPKEQSWYTGNSLANQNVGVGTTIYKHNPLPSYCNPNNDDYIPAAFLNPLVLEELRQDWKYLTYKNEAELKAKGYDFYDKFVTELCNDIAADCSKELITENPNLKRRTYIDPNGTMPLINNTNSQNGTQKSKLNDDENTLPRPKLLVKTEDYYSDLINNKLITMNPVWLANKQQKKCMPKISAIHNSINKGKKLKRKKLIRKKKN
ncbi:hypothetical protein [Lutibacter sp.]